jgi:hypothetical protein
LGGSNPAITCSKGFCSFSALVDRERVVLRYIIQSIKIARVVSFGSIAQRGTTTGDLLRLTVRITATKIAVALTAILLRVLDTTLRDMIWMMRIETGTRKSVAVVVAGVLEMMSVKGDDLKDNHHITVLAIRKILLVRIKNTDLAVGDPLALRIQVLDNIADKVVNSTLV